MEGWENPIKNGGMKGTGGRYRRTRGIDRRKRDVSTGMTMASVYGWAEPFLVHR